MKILLVFQEKELTAAASSIKSIPRFQCRKQERAAQRDSVNLHNDPEVKMLLYWSEAERDLKQAA